MSTVANVPQIESDALRATLDRHLATAADPWAALQAAGVTGLIVPEEHGGLGLPVGAAAPVFDALGAHGVATPFLETSVIAPYLLRAARSEAGDDALRAIAAGGIVAVAGLDPSLRRSVRATAAGDRWRLDGQALLVLDGATADHLLVAAQVDDGKTVVLLVSGNEGPAAAPYPTIDGRTAADLRFEGVAATVLIADAEAALEDARDIALAGLAAEAGGLMKRLVTDTVAYTKDREQFGQPIARFQVIQHRLVDMHIQARRAGAIAARAMEAIDGDRVVRARLASAAKVTVADAGRFVGQNAVQLHGGMGMTRELHVSRCFKRLTVIEHELGSADQHRTRYARLAASAAT